MVLRFPVVATLILCGAILYAITGIPKLGFSGDNVEILRDGSKEFADYDVLLNEFRDFNNDAIVLVRSDKLATQEGFETFRELHFELQFNENVQSVLSPFSLASFDPKKGGWRSTVPAEFESDEQVQTFLHKMAMENPSFQSLVSPERDSGVIVVYTKPKALEDANIRQTMASYRQTAAEYQSKGFDITIAGQPAIRSDLVQSIINDMRLLAPMAAIFCIVVSWLVFRNFAAVLICITPPFATTVIFFGGMGHAGIDLNFLTSVLPILLMVILFADTLHFYLKWARTSSKGTSPEAALEQAIVEIGPACSMAMITTGIALGSLWLSNNYGLFELATLGVLSLIVGFIAVLGGLPLMIFWAIKMGHRIKHLPADRLMAVVKPAGFLLKNPMVVAVVGLVLCLVGFYAHFNIDSRFRMIDYISTQSDVAKSESFIDKRYSGTTPLFAIVNLNPDQPMLSEANQDIFYRAKARIDQIFPSTSSYSLDDFAKELRKSGAQISEKQIDQLPEYMTSRFVSGDRRKVLITIFSSAGLTDRQMREKLISLKTLLKSEGLENNVAITGFPILSSVVAPRLMDKLRLSLLVAVLLAIALIMISARSFKLGLACIVPNLLPIVGVEIALWLAGIPLDMSITVALTVAFGIAVDNSIHLINQFSLEVRHHAPKVAILGALKEVAPAMISTTLILVAGLSITLLSELPILIVFSSIVILTLVIATITDIFQLPSYIYVLNRDPDS